MKPITRRRLIYGGTAVAAGVGGLGVAERMAKRYGLIPPDGAGVYGPGETLTYACQRLLTVNKPIREFPRSMISKNPFANAVAPPNDEFKKLHAGGFKDWRLVVDGTVAHPMTFSLADLKSLPLSSQITEVACEEGWSYIAEWIGTPLSGVLREAGVLPQSRYVVYLSIEKGLWESIDVSDARDPHTLLTMGMNDGDLPVGFGGPLRLRLPRQLGYKSLKYVDHITVTDNIKKFGTGQGSVDPDYGYAWYGGI
ncbi:MAG TPA: molybdopterin-dependent oxidoreductase [Terracidiphilus sp.]|jgi:DMSO/TMAO reductase YedYZ molybdopterin-dependent catalytic subunit|nr:molybdopterin-dependent oxidoreductase [Terracidiphilus sp.]